MSVFGDFSVPAVSFKEVYAERYRNVVPALAAGTANLQRDRPMWNVLCTWIDEMWQALDEFGPAAGPLGRYPFDGDDAVSWDLQTGVPIGTTIPPGGFGGLSSTKLTTLLDAGAQHWVHIDDRFYVLLRTSLYYGPSASAATFGQVGDLAPLAMPPIRAVELGLCYRLLEASVDHLADWWRALAYDNLATTAVMPPPDLEIWQAAGFSQPVSKNVVSRFKSWITGGQHPTGIANFEDPTITSSGGAAGNSGFIRWNKNRLGKPPNTDLEQLWTLAIEFWDRRNSAFVDPEPPGFAAALAQAARTLARTSGYLAHEIMHLVWGVETNRSSGPVAQEAYWGPVAEPPLFRPQAIQSYTFRAWDRLDFNDNTITLTEEQVYTSLTASPAAVGGAPPSRHWVVYLFGRYIQAILLNEEVLGAFLDQHDLWCQKKGSSYWWHYCQLHLAAP